jgi:hypothetical protein
MQCSGDRGLSAVVQIGKLNGSRHEKERANNNEMKKKDQEKAVEVERKKKKKRTLWKQIHQALEARCAVWGDDTCLALPAFSPTVDARDQRARIPLDWR